MEEIQYFLEGNAIFVAILPIIVTIANIIIVKEKSNKAWWQLFCLFYISSYSWYYWNQKWMTYVNVASFILSWIMLSYKGQINKKLDNLDDDKDDRKDT